MEKSLRMLEDLCQEYLQTMNHFTNRKAALEAGRLTESLLSIEHLCDVLAQETKLGVVPVQPLQWYYEYAVAEPVWDNDCLLYRVRLPLVEDVNYITYQLLSWPMPWNNTGYSSQIEVQPLLGLDTTTGDVFVPSRCYGQNSRVCRFGVKTHVEQYACDYGIITGKPKHREECVVKLRKTDTHSMLEEITPGEYILVTWGETVQEMCL